MIVEYLGIGQDKLVATVMDSTRSWSIWMKSKKQHQRETMMNKHDDAA